MGVLEKVLEMQRSGRSDSQITQTLLQERITPKEILDALSQSKIKSAVAIEEQVSNEEEMQPSIMSSNESAPESVSQTAQAQMSSAPQYPAQTQYQEQQYNPSAPPAPAQYQEQQYAPQTQYVSSTSPAQAQYQGQQYAPQTQYQEQMQYAPQPQQGYEQGYGLDLETIRDISRREIESSTIKLKQQTDLLINFMQELKTQMQIINGRTTKAESSIIELQSAIIRKMGEYGEAMSGISQEIKETQKSFSKMLNPILDKKRGISQEELSEQSEETQEQSAQESPRRSRQNSPGFEGFLR